MNTYDIYIALEWISWRLSTVARRRSKEYIDNAAQMVLQEAATSPHTSETVKVIAQEGQQKARQNLAAGVADTACNTLCKAILRGAKEEDFAQMLGAYPGKIVEWRKLWDAFRAPKPKIRRI